eukprot:scaffold518606_cov19-Prasinocladus_malaysianus.AAC.1
MAVSRYYNKCGARSPKTGNMPSASKPPKACVIPACLLKHACVHATTSIATIENSCATRDRSPLVYKSSKYRIEWAIHSWKYGDGGRRVEKPCY